VAGLLLLLLAPNAAVAEAEGKAKEALGQGKVLEALAFYEEALRAAADTATKARLRDAYVAAGWTEPPPTNLAEQLVLTRHIHDEKLRIFGQAADRFEGRDEPHAAILVRRAMVELLGGDAEGVKTQRERIAAIVRKLTESPDEEDKETVAKLLRAKREGSSLVKAARKLLQERRYRAAVRLCQEIMFGTFDQDVKNDAVALRKEAEEKAATDAPAAQLEAAKAVLADDRFERLEVARSRHFLFLGPKIFVDSIPKDQRTLLDLAYVYQSDLAAQPLTANGVRIVVYYQETFDFGGGLAGGKLIRIGNRAIRLPIAGMLHYHELGHCVFGQGWLHKGFTEGLADFAAGFTLDALGQTPQAQHFIDAARDAFVRYFLGRDVRYFDIQPYQPSAGFLFSFLPPGEAPFDWTPYRVAFRRMREAQFAAWPEREHQIMRYFGYLMAAPYGAQVYDTLALWGWPVSRRDLGFVPDEAESLLGDVRRGMFQLERGDAGMAAAFSRRVLEAAPDGPLAPGARFGLLSAAIALGDEAAVQEHKRGLGILDRYLVLGAFGARKKGAYVVLPPETRIDTTGPVQYGNETAHWRPAKVEPTGFVDLRQQGFGYSEDKCAFALAYVRCETATPARVWTGSDDGHTLLVNGELAEKRDTNRGFTFDDDFADVALRAGWNRILLKVHNSTGAWGFTMRVTAPDGSPIPGLEASGADQEAHLPSPAPPKTRSLPIVADDFKAFRSARWLVAVGGFDSQNGLLRPLKAERLGLWERFVVDPDKPKDGPANLCWLRSPDLARADSLEMELVAVGGGKFGFTIDGENENDGQSGHTFVIEEEEGRLACSWCRYDRLLYLQPGVEAPKADARHVRLRRLGRKWWLSVDDVPLFEAVDAPRLPAFGFGLMTWGPKPEFDSLRLARLEE
jgi:hypothetical protein